jgi:hypothetical protein
MYKFKEGKLSITDKKASEQSESEMAVAEPEMTAANAAQVSGAADDAFGA